MSEDFHAKIATFLFDVDVVMHGLLLHYAYVGGSAWTHKICFKLWHIYFDFVGTIKMCCAYLPICL